MTVRLCEHIIGSVGHYDPEAGGIVSTPLYCDKIAVRIWHTAGGHPVPACIEHQKGHEHAPLCYAGETE